MRLGRVRFRRTDIELGPFPARELLETFLRHLAVVLERQRLQALHAEQFVHRRVRHAGRPDRQFFEVRQSRDDVHRGVRHLRHGPDVQHFQRFERRPGAEGRCR